MFRRTFWFTAGAAAGVWATTKVNRKLRQLTPDSLAALAAAKAVDTGHRLKDFALDVRAGMAQREAELGEALGLRESAAPGQGPALTAAPRRPGTALPQAPSRTGAPAQGDAPPQESAPRPGGRPSASSDSPHHPHPAPADRTAPTQQPPAGAPDRTTGTPRNEDH